MALKLIIWFMRFAVVDCVADDMHVYHFVACLPVPVHYFLAFVDLGTHRVHRLRLLILQ